MNNIKANMKTMDWKTTQYLSDVKICPGEVSWLFEIRCTDYSVRIWDGHDAATIQSQVPQL